MPATRLKLQKHSSEQKVGFLPIPERAPKSAKQCAFFAILLARKYVFVHFFVLFLDYFRSLSGLDGTPHFVHFDVFFAVSAVWLELNTQGKCPRERCNCRNLLTKKSSIVGRLTLLRFPAP